MNVRGHKVPPMSRAQIRRVAVGIRDLLGLHEARVDLVRLVEHRLTRAGVTYDILSMEEMGGDEARAFPDDLHLEIREDVYRNLNNDDPRSRFTIPHELGHLVLHHGLSLARADKISVQHQAFEDSEWQADAFAAEFIMPVSIIQERCSCAADIEELFGVSWKAATIRYKILKGDNLI